MQPLSYLLRLLLPGAENLLVTSAFHFRAEPLPPLENSTATEVVEKMVLQGGVTAQTPPLLDSGLCGAEAMKELQATFTIGQTSQKHDTNGKEWTRSLYNGAKANLQG